MSPVFFIYGNCNAAALAFYLNQMTDLSSEYEIVHQSSFSGMSSEGAEVSRRLARAHVVWSQLDETNPLTLEGRVGDGCEVLTFPPCNSRAAWPFGARDPGNVAEPDFPYGRFPYGDTVLMQLADRTDIHHGNVEDAYETEVHRRRYDVMSRVELDIRTRQNRDRACDIRLFEYFDMHWTTTPLMATYNHPRRPYLEHLFFQLADATDAIPTGVVRDARHRASFLEDDFEPLGQNEVPVSSTVAQLCSLSWHSTDKPGAYHRERISPASYYGRYLDFRRADPDCRI